MRALSMVPACICRGHADMRADELYMLRYSHIAHLVHNQQAVLI